MPEYIPKYAPKYVPKYTAHSRSADEDEPEGISSFIPRVANWMAVENACRVIDRYVSEVSQQSSPRTHSRQAALRTRGTRY